MAERRPLVSAVNQYSGADPEQVRAFITQETKPVTPIVRSETLVNQNSQTETVSQEPQIKQMAVSAPQKNQKRKPTRLQPVGLIPVTIRLRPEIAGALKRASLERQLNGEETFTQQDLVENALEPWLQEEGYI